MTQPIDIGSRRQQLEGRAKTVESLVDALQERISDGEFGVGSWIRQERLAEEYGVSRMPIREALHRLQALGVVEIIANRGARVQMPSMRDIAEAYEVRGVLEGHAAYRAARSSTQADIDNLHQAVKWFNDAVGKARSGSKTAAKDLWYKANELFHATVIQAAGNSQLSASISALHHRMPRNLTWAALGGDPRLLADNAQEHMRIAEAIETRNAEVARQLTVEHSAHARELVEIHVMSRPRS
ncbi:DNA-binding GntR family transcriptional regulator [Arthrobacter sp. 2762]